MPDFTYAGFFSYSHAADGRLAPTLQSALHQFAKPWYRLRAMRLYRDKTTLAMTPELWPALEKALAQSHYFLLMASPQSAASTWVCKEIGWWLANRSSKTLLLLLTDGDLAWDTAEGDFDWERTDAIPRDLSRQFPNEPLYVDLRWTRDGENLSLRHSRFRGAVLDIAAPLLGKPKDELDGEDVRQHRRTRHIAWSAVIAIVLFALTAAWQAYVANQRYKEALSRQLAAQAVSLLPVEPDRALLLSVAALSVRDTVEARSGLLHATYFSPHLEAFLFSGADDVQAVAFSHGPDGRLVSGHANGDAVLWDVRQGGRRAALLAGFVDPETRKAFALRSVALTLDGQTIATGNNQGEITLWDAATGERRALQPTVRHDGAVNGLAFTPDGRRLVSASEDSSIIVQAVADQRQDSPRKWILESALTSVSVDSSGSTVAVGGKDGTIALWSLSSDRRRLLAEGNGEAVLSVDFSPDGKVLASAGAGGRVVLWDVRTGRKSDRQPGGEPRGTIWTIAFSPNNRLLAAAGADKAVVIWDLETIESSWVLRGHPGTVYALAWSADGGTLVSGDRSGRILRWDPAPREPWQRHEDEVWSVAFSPDGRTLASGSKDGTILVGELESGRQVALPGYSSHGIRSLAFTTVRGERVAAAEAATTGIVEWEVGPPPVRRILAHDEAEPKRLLSIPTRGVVISGSTDGRVTKWEAATGQSSAVAGVQKRDLLGLAAARDGRTAVSLYESGRALVWDVVSGSSHELDVGPRAVAIAISPDGRMLASGTSDGEVVVCDLAVGSASGEILGRHSRPVRSLAISEDGKVLASGDYGGAIMLWDLLTRQQLGPVLAEHRSVVTGLAFRPGFGSAVLASSSDDRAVRLWELDLGSLRRRACRVANRELTPGERRQYLGNEEAVGVCRSGLPEGPR